ncbi:hypothetical protein ACWDRS_16750 [Streptomyces griseus]
MYTALLGPASLPMRQSGGPAGGQPPARSPGHPPLRPRTGPGPSDRTSEAIAFGLSTDYEIFLLVPAVMTLLGRAAWWIPGPLDRILPHLDAEGGAEGCAETRAEPAGPVGKM